MWRWPHAREAFIMSSELTLLEPCLSPTLRTPVQTRGYVTDAGEISRPTLLAGLSPYQSAERFWPSAPAHSGAEAGRSALAGSI